MPTTLTNPSKKVAQRATVPVPAAAKTPTPLKEMHWTKVESLYTAVRRELRTRPEWRHGPDRVHEIAREGYEAVKDHIPVVGRRYCDLGCGVYHPFGVSAAMYLNGAGSTLGLDLHGSNPQRAAEALADLLMDCLAFPERWHWSEFSRTEFMARIRHFNLKALMAGDLAGGMKGVPLEHIITDIHSPLLPDESIDIMTSRAVLEHFMDFGRAAERFYALLRPGGVAAHVIDIVDHRYYEDPVNFHYWSFLTEDDDWSDGVCNRLRSCEIRSHFEQVGFEVLRYENRRNDLPRGLMGQVKGRFRAMSAEELSITNVQCVLRKPAR